MKYLSSVFIKLKVSTSEASVLQILSEVMKMSQMYCGEVPDRQMLRSTQNVFTKLYFLTK